MLRTTPPPRAPRWRSRPRTGCQRPRPTRQDRRRVVAQDRGGAAGAQLDEGVGVVAVGLDGDPTARVAALLGAPEQVHLGGLLFHRHYLAAQVLQRSDPQRVAALDDDGGAGL